VLALNLFIKRTIFYVLIFRAHVDVTRLLAEERRVVLHEGRVRQQQGDRVRMLRWLLQRRHDTWHHITRCLVSRVLFNYYHSNCV